ncbi:MAG: hypothetical protein C4K58_04350 [Flavobacteriaceae bacterium]|nr:MAG: hypothetical protein C4K58_04350 [Flavobacteriaceae bacterium]
MKLPKFLLADNLLDDEENQIFILHTQYPRFLINPETEEIEFFDDVSHEDETEIQDTLYKIIEEAQVFFDTEMAKYDQEFQE